MTASGDVGQLAVGDPVDLTNCDREPIQIPGSIQPHGVLLGVERSTMIVRQASANTATLLDHDAEELIDRPLSTALGPAAAQAIVTALGSEDLSVAIQTPIVVGGARLDCRLHESDGLLVCELEPAAAITGDQAWLMREITRTMSSFQRAEGVTDLADQAVEQVRSLTGYDRVMVYRFDADGHGEVIAEAREPSLQPYLGQHYPASDIPRQARELYLRQSVRVIVDVDYAPAPLIPAINPVSGRPLDLGLAALRSVSPIHLQYLRNMGVAATLTISLIHDGALWGMIACHHNAPRSLSPQLRDACTHIGEVLSLQFAREEQTDHRRETERLSERRRTLLDGLQDAPSLSTGLQRGCHELQALCDADGVAIVLDGVRVTSGTVPETDLERALVAHLDPEHPSLVTDRLSRVDPEIGRQTGLCGALAVALPRGVGEYVVWYRAEWRHEMVWGGDPNDSLMPDLSSRDAKTLSPRRSFEAWRQAVTGRSRPWSDAHAVTATQLGSELAEMALASMRDRLAHVALHDPLTGLANRMLLVETLQQALTRRPRAGREHIAVLFIDLDNFKLVNDSLGHGAGDALLQQVAQRLTDLVRAGDLVARLGGDEFIVVAQGISDPAEMDHLTPRLQALFDTPFRLLGVETHSSASIGLTTAELGDGRDADELIHEADLAMYEAKKSGRGRWARYGRHLSAERQRRIDLERHLRTAISEHELHLEYQPLLDSRLRVAGFEALCRWDSPHLGRIAPDEFIPIAEETGMMDELGSWVLDTALDALAHLHMTVRDDLFMTINISAAQLADATLPAQVRDRLDHHGVPGERVWLEITESLLIANTDAAVPALEDLRRLGVKIALDDFGTGFSSLAYLRRLPADLLKIDRAFIADLGETEDDAQVVGAVIELARRLKIETVAEGVESERQLDVLQRASCDLLQGYLFSEPVPGDQLPTIADLTPERRFAPRASRTRRSGSLTHA